MRSTIDKPGLYHRARQPLQSVDTMLIKALRTAHQRLDTGIQLFE